MKTGEKGHKHAPLFPRKSGAGRRLVDRQELEITDSLSPKAPRAALVDFW